LFSPTGDRYRVIIREEAGAVSWLQQLVGKLKSVFGGKSAPEEAATEAGTEPRAEVAEAPTAATPTEDTTGKAVAEAPAEPLKDAPALKTDAPALETTEGPAEPAGTAVTAEPAATVAEPAADSVEPATEAAPPADAAEVVPVADAEPVPAVDPGVTDSPVAEPVPAEERAPAEASGSTAPAKPELSAPAINTLDVEGGTADLTAGPYGPGSGKPASDGSAPSTDFTVKGKESSKLFHTEKSPYFSRTKADVWFKSEADAEGAGFQAWDHKKRAGAKK
jgi:hypothetical protein